MPKRKTVGVALSSGGVLGMAHVGALECLVDHDVPIDYLAGTSIGAWVAVAYALHRDIDFLHEVTIGYRKEKMVSLFEPNLKGGLVKGKKAKAVMHGILGDNTFGDLQIPTQVVATDIVKARPIVFSKGRLIDAVFPSAAVPLLFKPVEFQQTLLVDGAIVNPFPCQLVREAGADIVVGINVEAPRDTGEFKKKDAKSLLRTGIHVLNVMRSHLAHELGSEADVLVEPEFSVTGLRSWKKYFIDNEGAKFRQIGYDATEKLLPDIRSAMEK